MAQPTLTDVSRKAEAGCSPPQYWGRVLMVVAHPDDEVLALGGQLDTVQPRIVHLTTGAVKDDPNAIENASIRRLESREALTAAGLPSQFWFPGDWPDQAAVDFIDSGFERLLVLVQRLKPDCLLTHPYEGGHPDHDAAALLCRVVSEFFGHLPVYEFSSYHNGNPLSGDASWEVCTFLPPAGNAIDVGLTVAQQARKRALLSMFTSQAEVLTRFPLDKECFRIAPRYNFNRPPHDGRLLYETFNWNVNFQSWRNRAQVGLRAIGSYVGRPIEVHQ